MKHILLTIPTGAKVGLSTISIGLFRALDRQGVRVGFFKPISQPLHSRVGAEDCSTKFIAAGSAVNPPEPIPMSEVRNYISEDKIELMMEEIVQRFNQAAHGYDAIVVEGVAANRRLSNGCDA